MKYKNQMKEKYFFLLLFVLGILFFNLIGQCGYIEMKDSTSYTNPSLFEGVMPIYPLFLNVLHAIFGEYYLYMASFLQGVLAAICTSLFTIKVAELFRLSKKEGMLVWMASLLPFSIELPTYVITHVIYTESISYSLYYVYVICLLYIIVFREKKWSVYLYGVSLLLSLIRPQLLLLFIIWGVVEWIIVIKEKKMRFAPLNGMFIACAGIVFGVVLTYGMRAAYVTTIDRFWVDFFSKDELLQVEIDTGAMEYVPPVDVEEALRGNGGQFGSAIVVRGFFEAEPDDVKYYKTDEMKKIFHIAYRLCDEKKYLYNYAGKGLEQWEDLTKTYIYDEVGKAIAIYCEETGVTEPFARMNEIKLHLGLTEIFVHPLRFMYHSFRLMIPGFISCVFFNIEAVYLLCHLITFFLYASAMMMAIFTIKNRECDSKTGYFMLTILGCCVIFVGVTNLLFYGMQRYFLYQMGVFYCAYYLVFRQIFHYLLKKFREKIRC